MGKANKKFDVRDRLGKLITGFQQAPYMHVTKDTVVVAKTHSFLTHPQVGKDAQDVDMQARLGIVKLPRDSVLSFNALSDNTVSSLNELDKEWALVSRGPEVAGAVGGQRRCRPEIPLRIGGSSTTKRVKYAGSQSASDAPRPPSQKKQRVEPSPAGPIAESGQKKGLSSGEGVVLMRPLLSKSHVDQVLVPFLKETLVKGSEETGETTHAASMVAHLLDIALNMANSERRILVERNEWEKRINEWKRKYGALQEKECRLRDGW